MTCTNVLGYTRYKQHYLTTKLEFLGCYIALFSSNKTSLGFAMILFSGILRATPSVSLSTLSSSNFKVRTYCKDWNIPRCLGLGCFVAGLGATREYHGGTVSESWSSRSISQNSTLRAALWLARTWGILSAVLVQNLHRTGVIRVIWYGSYMRDKPLSVLVAHKVRASLRWCE